MRELSILLENIQPLSANAALRAVSRGGRVWIISSDAKRKNEINFNRELGKFKSELMEFKSEFDEYLNHIHASFYFYIPSDFGSKRFYTRKGKKVKISSRSGDLDNFLKSTIDSIFKYIGINDSYITRIECEKIPSNKNEFSIVAQLSIKNLLTLSNDTFKPGDDFLYFDN